MGLSSHLKKSQPHSDLELDLGQQNRLLPGLSAFHEHMTFAGNPHLQSTPPSIKSAFSRQRTLERPEVVKIREARKCSLASYVELNGAKFHMNPWMRKEFTGWVIRDQD